MRSPDGDRDLISDTRRVPPSPAHARAALRAQQLNPDIFMKSDEKLAQEAAEAAANPPQNPDTIKLQTAQVDAESRKYVADKNAETAMHSLAAKMNMTVQQLQAMLDKTDREIQSDERKTAVDAALTQRQMAMKAAAPQPNIATTGTVQ